MLTRLKSWASAGLNILLATLLLLTQGWMADSLGGAPVFTWSDDLLINVSTPGGWGRFGVLVLVALSAAGVLYWRRKSFLPPQIKRVGVPGQVEPHEVLIMAVSRTLWEVDSVHWQLRAKEQIEPLPHDLDAALTKLSTLNPFFSWEQLLRGMQPHASGVKRVVLICSKETEKDFGACRDLLLHYFPRLNAGHVDKKRVESFENLEALRDAYEQVIRREKGKEKHVMIDVTGGSKVVSIAGAMATFNHPDVEFQYVETEGEKRVRSFNVTTSSHD